MKTLVLIETWHHTPKGITVLYLDTQYTPDMRALTTVAEKKRIPLQATIGLYKPIRSTGPRSQNARLHGHCSDIADQMFDDDGEPVYTPEELKAAFKRMSVEEGYPTVLSLDGLEVPKPTRRATVEECDIIFKVINRFSDIHSYYLTEYTDDGVAYKSVGGRTRDEMMKFWRGRV